jgi:uncharacterized membrane protein
MGYTRLVRPGLLATTAALVVMAALSAWAYADLPQRVLIRWNTSGEADGWSSPTTAVVLMPLVLLGSSALLAVVPLVDPRRPNLERSAKAYRATWFGMAVMLTGIHAFMLFSAAEGASQPPVARFVLVLAGGLFLVVGNYLGKIRSNWFAGIRTPWTLSSERSWAKTHRLGGRLFVLAGAVIVIIALVAPVRVGFWVLTAGSVGTGVALIVYSFLVWRSDPERSTSGASSA